MENLETGRSFTSITTVDENNTATALGSGDMPVFATPAMIALMENAAMNAVAACMPDHMTTVGTHMDASHTKASAPGAVIRATATLTAVEGRKLTFSVTAEDEGGRIGEGSHTRYVVDRTRFLDKLK